MKTHFNLNTMRRHVMALAVATLGVTAAGGAAWAQNSAPVPVGVLTPKQGPSAAIGVNMARGAEMAVAMHQDGKVLGRPIQVVWLDEASPQVAQQNMQRLANEYKVAGVIGANSSASALAMMSVAQREKVPLISAGAAAREITGSNCNRYTFRTQASAPVQLDALKADLAGKRVYFLTPSYAFGQDVLRSGRALLKEAGGQEVGNDEVPVNTADYSSYILKIRQAKPEIVVGALVGLDLSNFMKQWQELGMKDKVPFYEVAVTDSDFWDIGPGGVTGTHVKPWYFNNPNNSALEQQFVERYVAQHGQPPSDKAWSGWIAMRSLLESIDKAGTTDSADVVRALEAWQATDGAFPAYYREWDHQLIRPAVVVRVKNDIQDKWDFFDVVKETTGTAEETLTAFGTQEQVGCTLGDL